MKPVLAIGSKVKFEEETYKVSKLDPLTIKKGQKEIPVEEDTIDIIINSKGMTYSELLKIRESEKYTLTPIEWNFIKKAVKKVVPHDIEIEFYKKSDYVNIYLNIPSDYLNLTRTTFEFLQRRNISTRFAPEIGRLVTKIRNFLDEFNITYQKADSMTDLPGSYRFSSIVNYTLKSSEYKNLKAYLERMYEIAEKENSFNSYNEDVARTNARACNILGEFYYD